MAKIAFLILSLNILQTFFISAAAFNPSRGQNISHSKITGSDTFFDQYHLPNVTTPLHYDLKLILIDNDNFYGEANISLMISGRTKNIYFHSDRLGINHQAILLFTDNGTIYSPFHYAYYMESQVNDVHFSDWLSENKLYHIFIRYTGTINSNPDTKGFFKSSYMKDGIEQVSLFTTIFRGIGARRVFPCWDEPSSKATFNISVKHSKQYMVLSNIQSRERLADIDGMTWTHFDADTFQLLSYIPPYHVAIVLYDPSYFFVTMSINVANSMTMIMHPKFIQEEHIEFAAYIAEKVMQYMTDTQSNITWWHVPRHIAIINFPLDITENNAIMFYRAQDIVFNEIYDTLYNKFNIARIISRKVVYHWLGNAFVPYSWAHLWIAESMCVLFGLNALTEVHPELRAMDYSIVQMQHDSFHLDTNHVMEPLMMNVGPINIDNLFSFQYHLKGPLILRMIETVLTGRTFWDKIKEYLIKELIRWTVHEQYFEEFWEYIESEFKGFYIYHHFPIVPLSKAMYSWATTRGYPVLIVLRDYESGRITVQLLQSSYKLLQPQHWYIHMTYATETNPEFTYNKLSTKARWFLVSPSTVYNFENVDTENVDDWIIINLRQTGYYRVMYDERNWMRLARFLKNCEYLQIDVLNRAQIVDDAYYLLTEGHITFSLFKEITQFLGKQEMDYIAWYPMLKAFEYMSGFLPYPESERLRMYMDSLLSRALSRLKYTVQPHDDEFVEYLRQELIRWLCIINNPICRGVAFNQLSQYNENPTSYKFMRGMRELTFCNGLGIASSGLWYNILDTWRINRDSEILKYLACADNSDIIFNYLNLLESDGNITKLEPIDHINIFFFIVRRHAKNDVILKYILTNFQSLKPKSISKVAAFTVIINHVYSEKQLELIKETTQSIVKGQDLQNIKWKIEERLRQIKHQINSFRGFIKP